MTETTTPQCSPDADGFCPAHGNDCDDYRLYLAEQQQAEHTISQDDEVEETEQTPEPEEGQTIAFLADSRASTLLIEETVDMLSGRLAHALVELHSPVGVRIAAAVRRAGIDFSVLSFGQPLPESDGGVVEVPENPGVDDAGALLAEASQIVELDPQAFAELHAQLCIVPTCAGSDRIHLDQMVEPVRIDLAPTTLPGLVSDQAQMHGRSMIVIDVPERGLVREASGRYRRRVLHLGLDAAAEMDTEDAEQGVEQDG